MKKNSHKLWMVRAGEGGYVFEYFKKENCVAIGWKDAGDFTSVKTQDDMRKLLSRVYPEEPQGWLGNAAAATFKFRHTMKIGDHVVTYNPQIREYLFGTVSSEYEYDPERVPDHPHVRRVQWKGSINRDNLSVAAKNTLGSTLTLFEPGEEVLQEFIQILGGSTKAHETVENRKREEQEFETIRREVLSRAHEFIKDQILSLSFDEMEELIASLLRAMGYKTRLTQKGADRGRDIIASPDGLGFQQPRIIVEVKHRPKQSIGAEMVRSFISGLREGDRGLYVSTGGFTKESRYEAERSTVPMMLVDLDELVLLIIDHYDSFDAEGRSLLPLDRVYWPVARGVV